jgi:hypothetical protein
VSFAENIDGAGDHNAKHNKPDSEIQIPHVFSHMWKLVLKKKRY